MAVSSQIRAPLRRAACAYLTALLVLLGLLPVAAAPASEPAPDLPQHDTSSPFGIVATLGNRVRGDEMPAAVDLMREAGVQWQREEIFWDRVQKTPDGPFVWNGDGSGFYDYDRAIQLQVEAGINVLGLLDYNPYWFKSKNPPPEAWLDDWGAFVYAAVARYGRDRGWIKHWELWNEPNIAASGYESGLYEIKHFVRLLEIGAAAARAADPEARIVMGGMSGVTAPDTTSPNGQFTYDSLYYLDQVGALGGWQHVDIIALHPYHGIAPEQPVQRFERLVTLRDELRHLDDLLRRYGPKPIWLTEFGWSTNVGPPGVSEHAQALYLVRGTLIALAHPSVEKIFWYDLRNDTHPNAPYHAPRYNPREVEFHYGLLRRHYPLDPARADLRKPGFVALRTLATTLGGLPLQRVHADGDSPEHPGLYWYAFGNNQRRVDVLWRVGEAAPAITVGCGDCREALLRGWDGKAWRLVPAHNGAITVTPAAPGLPVYIVYDPPAAPDGELFAATGHTLRGALHAAWYARGGLERFGNPITEELIEPDPISAHPRVVQYFERARLVVFPEHAGTPAEVQTSGLGRVALQRAGLPPDARTPLAAPPPECSRVAASGYHLCPPFRAVWEHYEGVASLGAPLTEALTLPHPLTGAPTTMQFFEHARLELGPDPAGTSYTVQFGLIGTEALR